MKKILGLDLGTNSIGWAVVNAEVETRNDETSFLKPVGISAAGSRIIPMSADVLSDFDKGNTKSQTADRTKARMARRLHERNIQRRERLLRTLKIMGFLPEHFSGRIDRFGKFIDDSEPKLVWRKDDDGKMEFLFQSSFNEMLADFSQNQPQLVANGKRVPYDWTIYYLRKKALTQRISKEELAWVLLQFNQKRGYYQLRGEDEEENSTAKTRQYFDRQIICDIVDTGQEYKGLKVLTVTLQNGDKGKVFKKDIPNWIGQEKSIIVTIDIDKDGRDKFDENGQLSRKFKIPTEAEWDSEWKLIKLKTEKDLDNSNKTVGCYIYDALLANPKQKIIGKLVRTVERKFYKDELIQILKTQQELIPELKDDNLYKRCIEELYPHNEAHRNNIAKPDFVNLFVNDILFYQRPLKSKKSLISDCPYETRFDEDGNKHPVKCIAKSNPLFQEFRLWQFVQNLRIYEREKEAKGDADVTNEFLKTEEDYVKLFDWLNDRVSIKQDTLLNSYFKIRKQKGQEQYPYRWNYVEDKEYPCNKTRAMILSGLAKCGISIDFLSRETEMHLWHILYSVEDKTEIGKALRKFGERHGLSDSFAEVFGKIKPFKKDYGSYSEKAIKKLLSLMRMGKYWDEGNIDSNTRERIEKIITGEYDETIGVRTREQIKKYEEKTENKLDAVSSFKKLPVWLACYIVYDRHSEALDNKPWKKPEDIDLYLKDFKQHSLHNPIVEQVITETLRTVRDIWKQEGQIDEIHVELGREMKNTAEDRAKITLQNTENEQSNLRIKALLSEFLNSEYEIDNVRPYSPSQQEILKIYEENALGITYKVTRNKETKTSKIEIKYASNVPDDIIGIVTKLNKREQPTKSEFMRYKLWLEQKYRSPYTGEIIPLAKLFTSAYEIEHIIPQSLYFDDSFSNKVICEAEVNKLKDRMLGYEFIKVHHGEKVQLSQGKTVEVFSVEDYEKFVRDHYASNRTKMKKLLMDDIPDGFIERQLNDSRYISKVVKGLLSNIVREDLGNGEYEQEAVSKNLISCSGSITDRLKKDWGMNDVWNTIVLPRFIRLNELTNKISAVELVNEFKRLFEFELSTIAKTKGIVIDCSYPDFYKSLKNDEKKSVIDNVMKQLSITESFLSVNNEGHLIPNMPLELQKGFNKKRIDHRHHAMDAIVIACTTRDHVNLLNNEAAHSKYESKHNVNRYQLQRKLRRFEKEFVDGNEKVVAKEFLKPWDSFTTDAKQALENIIVSFKQNLRVINKTTNYYESYNDEEGNLRIGKNGKPEKGFNKQEKGDSWAIRKSMHKDTVFGEVNLWRREKFVKLETALKQPKRIVNKDFKKKVLEMLTEGRDFKYIQKYVKENKDTWSDIDISKIEVYYYTQEVKDKNGKVKERYFATRYGNDLVSVFKGVTNNEKAKEVIKKTTDTGIQKILLHHLETKGNNPELAFSADGIDEMNRIIVDPEKSYIYMKNGKIHQPILKVRVYEQSEKKFAIGKKGNKKTKFVETDDGTNLFFAVFVSEKLNKGTGEAENVRSYCTIPLNVIIDCQKQFGTKWRNNIEVFLKEKELADDDAKLLFILSPNDLVYLPTKEELSNGIKAVDRKRIYKFIDPNSNKGNFVPYSVSNVIFSVNFTDQKKRGISYPIQDEFGVGSQCSKNPRAITGEMIKETCVPIKVDRLGNIIELNGKKL